MKKSLLILLSLVLLSGCSSFYHAHYRKLDKIDASGILAVKKDSIVFPAIAAVVLQKQHGIPAAKKLLCGQKISVRKKNFQDAVEQEKLQQPVYPAVRKPVLPAKQFVQKRKSDNHLGGLIPVFLLLLSILFIIWGISAFVAGIFLLSPVMMIAGILLILVGGMPVLVQIRNAIATRRNKNLYEPKH